MPCDIHSVQYFTKLSLPRTEGATQNLFSRSGYENNNFGIFGFLIEMDQVRMAKNIF
jgi:hypothetical protein